MNQLKMIWIAAIAALIVLQHANAQPLKNSSRQKRFSDQRLAELETLIALANMKSKMVTIPVGFGIIDPLKIGRRKRSVEKLLSKLLADASNQEGMAEELRSEEDDDYPDTVRIYDGSQRISRYRHLPVRLPK